MTFRPRMFLATLAAAVLGAVGIKSGAAVQAQPTLDSKPMIPKSARGNGARHSGNNKPKRDFVHEKRVRKIGDKSRRLNQRKDW